MSKKKSQQQKHNADESAKVSKKAPHKDEIDYKKVAEELAKENAQLNEQLMRERADAMNVRRRAEQDRFKMAGYYKASVVRELLHVIDNFERAVNALGDGDKTDFEKGITSIHKQLLQSLEKVGVERIKSVGEHFDPELHEAVTMEEGDGEHEIVSEELQSGYKIGDEVIRHAMVRVKS